MAAGTGGTQHARFFSYRKFSFYRIMTMSWEGNAAGSDSVFLDFVLECSKADAEQLGGFFAVVGDFHKSAADHFSFNLFTVSPYGWGIFNLEFSDHAISVTNTAIIYPLVITP